MIDKFYQSAGGTTCSANGKQVNNYIDQSGVQVLTIVESESLLRV